MRPCMIFFEYSNGKTCNFLHRMVLEWREHEHGEVEKAVRAYLTNRQALCACGLYMFWCLGGLRVKPRLLEMLVDYWDPDFESFQIHGMSLTVGARTLKVLNFGNSTVLVRSL